MGNPFFILTKDPEGKKSIDFGVYGIPETILVNQDLIILKKYIGPLDLKDVNEIKKIINK
jgi:cytochrome c biogenesis protein CcmG/thiol:disulfide interchange protein DsbE